jgi:peptidoglycan/xylan/chitin deacetylase (PgdA/CDA1 family)
MLRHLLAPVHPPFAQALGLPRTLAEVPQPPAVAITFDDGPHPEGTPAILEILARHGATATFFVIGEQVVKRPELVRRIAAGGHAIALHGYHHRLHLRRTAADLRADFTRGAAAIEDAIGQTPKLHRPPYGIYSPVSLRIARANGLEPLLWTTWGKDWRKFTTPERIARRAVTGIQAGDVILLHDADFYSSKRSHERTAAALELVLARLESGAPSRHEAEGVTPKLGPDTAATCADLPRVKRRYLNPF